ncbi:MAG TPA: hypothetical protein VEG60_34505 [Candidatus Binatia bacterium]|nr:hypothetical protein [Candidatus Binatia bacterium]
MRTAIFPDAAMEAHLAGHGVQILDEVRYRGGRTPGSVNRYSSSSTGVEHKKGIRCAR